MSVKTAGYLILYGAFLIVCGALGYWSNPEQAKTALMSGGAFGALSILWGALGARGLGWSLVAAKVTTGLLALVFAWRASVTWKAVIAGNSDKLFAAGLITAMLVGSVVMLVMLQIGRETPADKPPGDPLA